MTAAAPAAPPDVYCAKQWKVVCLREARIPAEMRFCETPDHAAAYWFEVIAPDPQHTPEVETFCVLLLNTRRRVIAYHRVSTGTLDTILVHAREVFRPAIIANAAAVILMHNHPSGEPAPSEADVKITRDLIRAGQLLKIEVLDHVVIGHKSEASSRGWVSLREMGYFFT